MELNLTIMEQCYVILLRKIYKKLEQTCREVDEDYGFESDPEFDQEMLKSLLPIACMELGCPNQVATKISTNLEDVPPKIQQLKSLQKVFLILKRIFLIRNSTGSLLKIQII